MSILIKRTDTNSSGGSSKGYPPGNVSNVEIKGSYKKVTIKWSDPEDIVVGGKTLSTWKSTILVRKKGSIPTSIKDGTIVLTNTERNKYKDTQYEDITAEVGHTYYYRFYTLSTDKVYNDSTSMIYSVTVVNFDPILKNNTWEQVIAAVESGNIPSTWNIGDEIDITLSGTYNETVTLQIWDFNHFDKSDGTGKAGIVFGMKNLMKDKQRMNTTKTNSGGWNNAYMKRTIMTNILSSMPSELQSAIKEVNTYANKGSSSESTSQGLLSKDKVFVPGYIEVGINGWSDQMGSESAQKKFPIFTDKNSRIKCLPSGGYGSEGDWWWLRSPYCGDSYDWCCVTTGGSYGDYSSADYYGVCFCFNV